ncbi:MAG: DNA polymerase III subunit chi [Alphaproteobacteria bacterium]
MVEVSFYHLIQMPLSRALPKLLEQSIKVGKKSVVRVGKASRISSLSRSLWVYQDDGWLPHAKQDEDAKDNIIWLTAESNNPIEAEFLFAVEQASIESFEDYERVFYLFDGTNDMALKDARALWKNLSNQDVRLSYWKQDDSGKWKKAS